MLAGKYANKKKHCFKVNEHSADRFQEVAKPEFMLISSEMVPIVITRNLIILN